MSEDQRTNRKLFHAAHYNILAARINEEYAKAEFRWPEPESNVAKTQLELLAILLCERFMADNDSFKPEMFLRACSPEPDKDDWADRWSDYLAAKNIAEGSV